MDNSRLTPLTQRVYTLLKTVPPGYVTTYKDLAQALGTTAYRAIGQMMRNNPYAPDVPCHRVVSSNGFIGGFMGKTTGDEIQKKIGLLEKEGVRVVGSRIQNFQYIRFQFTTS